MAKFDVPEIQWKNSFSDVSLDAAHDYLALRLTPARAAKVIPKFKDAPITQMRVNDLLRACDRDPLPVTDRGVVWKLDRLLRGKKLMPALVVSFDGVGADVCQGFHELSLASDLDPYMVVPVFIAYEGA